MTSRHPIGSTDHLVQNSSRGRAIQAFLAPSLPGLVQLGHSCSKFPMDEHNFHQMRPKLGAHGNHCGIFLPLPRILEYLPSISGPWASRCPRPLQRAQLCNVALKNRYRRASRPPSLLCSFQVCAALETQRDKLCGALQTPLCCFSWAMPGLSNPWGVLCALDSSLLSSTFPFTETLPQEPVLLFQNASRLPGK